MKNRGVMLTRRRASPWPFAVLTLAIGVLVPVSAACAKTPDVTRFTLKNGLRVVVLHVEDSKHIGIFSFLPLALASDGRGKAQWSHLVEHLTLRTTGPIVDYQSRNGETGADLMRLDFMGSRDEWREGLELQSRWLSGLPLTEDSLREEAPKALSELESTVAGLFTHKWAVAAWNQVTRHGLSHVSIREPVRAAKLADVEAYRDAHLVDPKRVVICVIGGVPPAELRPVIVEKFERIVSKAKGLPAATRSGPKQKAHSATWDLKVTHYLEFFPAPDVKHADFAPLFVASILLRMRLYNDAGLKKHTSVVLCDLDLSTPEGRYFQVSAPLKSEASLEPVEQALRRAIDGITGGPMAAQLPFLAMNLANQLRQPPDIDQAMRFKPAQVSERMILGNLGIQWGMNEYRFGEHRDQLADAVQKVTLSNLESVVQEYLSEERRRTLTLRPRE